MREHANIAGDLRIHVPENRFFRVKAVLFNIIDVILQHDIEGYALAAVEAHAPADRIRTLGYHARINTIMP
jgi:hypothetical protein